VLTSFRAKQVLHAYRLVEMWIGRCKRKDERVTSQYEKVLRRVDAARTECEAAGWSGAVKQISLLYARLQTTCHETASMRSPTCFAVFSSRLNWPRRSITF
jgi:hypothetical protein